MDDAWRNETIAQTRDRLRRVWGDYLTTIIIINPINIRLVRLLGRTALTPNQLTVIAFCLTVASALCFSSPDWGFQSAGGGLLLLAFLVDCMDGDLARFKGLKSPLGAMLDPIFDRLGASAHHFLLANIPIFPDFRTRILGIKFGTKKYSSPGTS